MKNFPHDERAFCYNRDMGFYRFGLSAADAGTDDPVAFFDGYFRLKGSREKGKPLKLYFAHRIAAEGIRLFDFVCGTLFGSRSGRVHDIVVDMAIFVLQLLRR